MKFIKIKKYLVFKGHIKGKKKKKGQSKDWGENTHYTDLRKDLTPKT